MSIFLDTPAGRAVVAESDTTGLFVLDRELFKGEEWPFFCRYAIVSGDGQGHASTDSFSAAKELIKAVTQ